MSLFFSRGDALTADTAVEGHSSHFLLPDMHEKVSKNGPAECHSACAMHTSMHGYAAASKWQPSCSCGQRQSRNGVATARGPEMQHQEEVTTVIVGELQG